MLVGEQQGASLFVELPESHLIQHQALKIGLQMQEEFIRRPRGQFRRPNPRLNLHQWKGRGTRVALP
jgi:hypothetical protein